MVGARQCSDSAEAAIGFQCYSCRWILGYPATVAAVGIVGFAVAAGIVDFAAEGVVVVGFVALDRAADQGLRLEVVVVAAATGEVVGVVEIGLALAAVVDFGFAGAVEDSAVRVLIQAHKVSPTVTNKQNLRK